jgi:hypothetical protein
MLTLTKDQRNLLGKTVIQARDTAESGAKKALHTLGVDDSDASPYLSSEQRELRRALRAQAKQLGNSEHPQKPGTYSILHLTEKIAYDQWHRMLFARFLAENNLLISPKPQVAVTLEECNDLAPELGLREGWQVASMFAAEMLPQIFRANDPSGQIVLAPEDRAALQHYVIDLPKDIFLSDDALGWVYQFWQEKRKDEVNRSEKKIGADELAPVTQLFTEDYMVLFLLHNTLGAWWAGKHKEKLKGLSTEEECRKALALNSMEWTYLRFIKDEKTAEWIPAAGTFDGWPKTARDLRVLDPCMGSGHFLVFALPIIVAFRMEEEHLSRQEACDSVLQENLFGLELDMRCTQIGVFNLAIKAWKMAGYRSLPSMNIACCGLGINTSKEEWLKLANGDERLRTGLEKLHDIFRQAPILGSLINPSTIQASRYSPQESDLFSASYAELRPLFEKALAKESQDDIMHEMAVTARGLAKAAELLANRYTLVATNVPYLGRGKQDDILKHYLETHYKLGKADLATTFVQRCLEFCVKEGTSALVTPQNWLFLTTYTKLRQDLLKTQTWNFVARLGEHAFESSAAAGAFGAMLVLSLTSPNNDHTMVGIDVSAPRGQVPIYAEDKAAMLRGAKPAEIVVLKQEEQLKNPDARISFTLDFDTINSLQEYAYSAQGIGTTDNPRFVQKFWEQTAIPQGWEYFQTAAKKKSLYSGYSSIFAWGGQGSPYFEHISALKKENRIGGGWQAGSIAWGRPGLTINVTSEKIITIFSRGKFDTTVGAVIPRDIDNLCAIYAYIESSEYLAALRQIDQALSVTEATLVKVPFDLTQWQKVAAEKYQNGLPEPESDDPTEWLFHGRPEHSTAPPQVAVARLLGYRWPAESDEKMRLSERARDLVKRCDELLSFVDDDGIVCLNPIKGEQPAADRLRELLAAAYGTEWNSDKQAQLLKDVGYEVKNIEEWLRNGFFEQHCKLFHNRPFIWQIWDGRKDGFSALVNYHKLDKPTLEKLTYTYLGDWIARQKSAVEADEEGSDARLVAAMELKKKLEKILEGEPPYDIFVRWKPLEKQPIGWEPDLNDGVRMNIRPFVTAGVLRKNPNIKWKKDRGKDVESAPWYHLFKGDRINDHHLTVKEKREARERVGGTNG